MAIMIPEKPRMFNEASLENIMFESLAELSDEYYVFHSFKIVTQTDGVFYESETDFVIFNKKKGIICLEAKAGQVSYKNGDWIYSNGVVMHNGGPFNQASANKWKLKSYIEKSNQKNVIPKCKMLHAVWFPSISEEDINKINLPSDADKKIIMTKSAIEKPQPFIDAIFELELPNGIKTNLTENEGKTLIQNVLCPSFSVFPAASMDADIKKIAFHRLLNEQAGILHYLNEQRSAVINGVAGTGKTMIAVEKARMHANVGQRVLFLCYNNQLKNYLAENYKHENISFYTIDGLACKLCNTGTANYSRLQSVLEDIYLSNNFSYQHVIIDEGQDFGKELIEESDIIQLLGDIVLEKDDISSFYIFYDKLQLVQGRTIPKYIEEADCKLTLYKNCRNTENIAITSMRPLTDRKPKLFDGCIKGKPAIMHFCSNDNSLISELDKTIAQLLSKGITDIVILTCKSEENSKITPYCRESYYKKIRFSTCRKFKGLEADAVILIDIDKECFYDDNVLLFYVGTSRARINLDLITTLNKDECTEILNNVFNITKISKKSQKEFAAALSALCEIVD